MAAVDAVMDKMDDDVEERSSGTSSSHDECGPEREGRGGGRGGGAAHGRSAGEDEGWLERSMLPSAVDVDHMACFLFQSLPRSATPSESSTSPPPPQADDDDDDDDGGGRVEREEEERDEEERDEGHAPIAAVPPPRDENDGEEKDEQGPPPVAAATAASTSPTAAPHTTTLPAASPASSATVPPVTPPKEASAGASSERATRSLPPRSRQALELGSLVPAGYMVHPGVPYQYLADRRMLKGSGRLQPSQVCALKLWVAHVDHWERPYPTEEDKTQLAQAYGMTLTQVSDWFRNERKRVWLPIKRTREMRGLAIADAAEPGEACLPSTARRAANMARHFASVAATKGVATTAAAISALAFAMTSAAPSRLVPPDVDPSLLPFFPFNGAPPLTVDVSLPLSTRKRPREDLAPSVAPPASTAPASAAGTPASTAGTPASTASGHSDFLHDAKRPRPVFTALAAPTPPTQ
jgi:hypothetical protein